MTNTEDRHRRKLLYIKGVYADAMRRARWREISAFSEQEGNSGTFGAKSPQKNPEVRSRGVRAGVGWRTSNIPPIEAERFSSGLANSQDPPGHENTAAQAGTKRDGDIKRSEAEHNTCDHLNQPLLLLHLSGSSIASFTAGGETHVVDVSRGCVTCTAARKMLALGVDPAEQIDVRRDGKPVFTRC